MRRDARRSIFRDSPRPRFARRSSRGDFSAREAAESALARIDALDGDVHAFNQVTPELALEAADRVDDMVRSGASPDELPPLAGVPVAFKDNMNLVGTHTTCSSRILESYQSVYDCTAVRRVLDAGAVPVGKLNMDEFAFGSSTENSAFGVTHNPWDLERVPGGSSGGSAAAVSAGMATIALGSDTGGSIRQPGALCGVAAMKPTYGRVSRYGVVAFASSLDQIGPFAKTVEECALVLNAICGKDPMDATSVKRPAEDFADGLHDGVKGLRIGIVSDMLAMEGCSDEVREAVHSAAETYRSLGAEVGETTLPAAQHGLSAYYIIGPAEASSNLARFDGIRYGLRVPDAEDVLDLYMRSRAEGFGPETIRRVMLGTYALSAGYYDAYYGQAQKARTRDRARLRCGVRRLRRAADPDLADDGVQDRGEGRRSAVDVPLGLLHDPGEPRGQRGPLDPGRARPGERAAGRTAADRRPLRRGDRASGRGGDGRGGRVRLHAADGEGARLVSGGGRRSRPSAG